MTNKDFTLKYGNFAREVTRGTGIFPETLLGQAAVESNGGESTLSKVHNNFFGIKADKSWNGAKVLMKTREVVDGKSVYIDSYFRKYASPADSFRDYVTFLKVNPRYTKAGVFTAPNYTEQIKRIAAAGYATGTSYANVVTKVAQNVEKALKNLIDNFTDNDGAALIVGVIALAGLLYLYTQI